MLSNNDGSAYVYLPKEIVAFVPYLQSHQATNQAAGKESHILKLASNCTRSSLILFREMLHLLYHINFPFEPAISLDSHCNPALQLLLQ